VSLQNNTKQRGTAFAICSIAALILLPIFALFVLGFQTSGDMWAQLWASVLPRYIAQTFLLLLGVGILSSAIAVPLAWLLTAYKFPASKQLQWLALLPLAMPTYIIAYLAVDQLNYAGPLQTALRHFMDWQKPTDYQFPEIRSLGGAIIVMSLVLYPYIFVSAHAAFLKQSASQIEVSRTLGQTAWGTFFKIILPQARPALVIGVSLVLLETLNDIGAMNFFGVQTFTLAIYTTWLGQGNLAGAAQLSLLLLVVVAAILWIEQHARGQGHALRQATKVRRLEPIVLKGWKSTVATLTAFAAPLLGFFLPCAVLLSLGLRHIDRIFSSQFLQNALHSLLLAFATVVATLLLGLVFAYAKRRGSSKLIHTLILAATTGYAIPGIILGLGFLVVFGRFDNWLSPILSNVTGVKFGLLLSGSTIALVLAYVARFLAMGFGAVDTGLQKIPTRLDDVARTLGRKPNAVITTIHLPLLRPALFSGAILVFVDCMKELPATLLLRPFDYDTLASSVFTLASLDKLEESAAPALAIVLVGLVPIYLLSRNMARFDDR
jgi:iron(III) transport system permease protein